jgi:hypothetical protein
MEQHNDAPKPAECSSPPPAAMPARQEQDPAAALHQLARQLIRNRSRALLHEYLRLRRTCR